MSQVATLTSVRDSNEIRAFSNREYIGGVYFLCALGMVQYVVGIAMIQAYVLPLKRFEHIYAGLASPKIVTVLYSCILSSVYFLISVTGGMTGFIVATAVLMLWVIALIFVGIIRRFIRHREEDDEIDTAEHPENVPDDKQLGRTAQARQSAYKIGRRENREKNPWAISPAPMAPWQFGSIFINTFLLLLTLTTILLIVYLWQVPTYKIVNVSDVEVAEFIPGLTAKALQFMYAYPTIAVKLQLDVYVRLLTEYCGVTYRQNITDDGEKKKLIHDEWIALYQINMTEYVKQTYSQFSSVNDWFTRAIDLNLRPLPTNQLAVVSPADARTLVFNSVVESRQWLKGYELDHRAMLGNVVVEGSGDYFASGGMVISRLAPQDYHRFHSPVAGTITHIEYLAGSLWSVSADAARSGNDAFLNQRYVVIIDAGPTVGKVAFVAIGATCVGSVVLQTAGGTALTVGQLVDRGDQLGIMQFGGSTVVTLFKKNRITFDENLTFRTRFPVETYVKVNQQIGLSRS